MVSFIDMGFGFVPSVCRQLALIQHVTKDVGFFHVMLLSKKFFSNCLDHAFNLQIAGWNIL